MIVILTGGLKARQSKLQRTVLCKWQWHYQAGNAETVVTPPNSKKHRNLIWRVLIVVWQVGSCEFIFCSAYVGTTAYGSLDYSGIKPDQNTGYIQDPGVLPNRASTNRIRHKLMTVWAMHCTASNAGPKMFPQHGSNNLHIVFPNEISPWRFAKSPTQF